MYYVLMYNVKCLNDFILTQNTQNFFKHFRVKFKNTEE